MTIANRPVRVWLRGLIAAIVNSAASSVTVVIVDPQDFSPFVDGGLAKLGTVTLVSAVFGAALYLKEHPVPDEPIGAEL